MSLFSLIPYNAHSQNLPFCSKETTATDNKCSLFPNITCEMALEIFNALEILLEPRPMEVSSGLRVWLGNECFEFDAC